MISSGSDIPNLQKWRLFDEQNIISVIKFRTLLEPYEALAKLAGNEVFA